MNGSIMHLEGLVDSAVGRLEVKNCFESISLLILNLIYLDGKISAKYTKTLFVHKAEGVACFAGSQYKYLVTYSKDVFLASLFEFQRVL